jgi:putative transposase
LQRRELWPGLAPFRADARCRDKASPLYAFKQAADAGGTPSPETITGIVWVILWSLIVIVSFKYAILIMRADVVILDGAGWHGSHGLVVPGNITLLALPPYSPELNPVERVWHYLRSHWLANSVFRSLADIMDACEMAWNRFATDHRLVRSLCAVAWAPASPAI